MAALGAGDKLIVFLAMAALALVFLPVKLCLIGLVSVVGAYVYSLYDSQQYWRRLGIPTPPGNLFFGHTLKVFGAGGAAEYDLKAFNHYGDTYGSYIFGRNAINTQDLDFLRSVTVKEFASFTNRQTFVSDTTKEIEERSLMRSVMTQKKGEEWKRIRNSVTPVFTTGKIRRLIPLLNDSVGVFCQAVDKLIGEGREVALKDMFGRLALDVIGRAGFSLDLNLFEDILHKDAGESTRQQEENPFLFHTKKFFTGRIQSWRFIFMAFCPWFVEWVDRVFGWDMTMTASHHFYTDFLTNLYDERKRQPDKFNDYFNLLISVADEAPSATAAKSAAAEDSDIIHKELQSSATKKYMSKMEVIAQSFILLLAGYETTGTTLQFIAYILAALPEIQERVRDEIDEVMGDAETVTYEHIMRMHYMNQVIMETLRQYPPAPRTNRECNADITIHGIPLRKNDLVTVPVYAIHYDPRHYPDPERFDPDRWSPDEKAARDPLTYLPFGYGPRNCIGMRFAEFEIRVTLASVLKQFRLSRGPNSPDLPLKIDSKGLLKPVETLSVRAERISH